MCPACNNHNYASREVCNKCQLAKPPSGWAPPPGFALPSAGPGQFEVCKEFKEGRCMRGEDNCRYAHLKGHEEQSGNMVTICRSALGNKCMREFCKFWHPPAHLLVSAKAVVDGAQASGQAAAGWGVPGLPQKKDDVRAGDWLCQLCNNHNYASRTERCGRCQAPKPPDAPPPTQSPAETVRQGDWVCTACGNHNYASRDICNKCRQTARPGTEMPAASSSIGAAPPPPPVQ